MKEYCKFLVRSSKILQDLVTRFKIKKKKQLKKTTTDVCYIIHLKILIKNH